ncbi:hypothetical protein OG730_00750 [Streptomyces sp. NBC_01298]|uniref:hypothetical protein n=1 Tax=Streptomyces sp. NBC_01298 TaxID=2903817 RepID=UPI002E15B63C|nr:hypothetical protein OG730_00750 [Streptomyces sp. NBC_01298]
MNLDVPGPEAGWLDAPVSARANPNPAWQTSMWWYVSGLFRVVAGLAPSLDSVAGRLKLTTERGWEELSPVDVAMIQIRGVHFALHRMEYSPMTDTIVSVINETDDDEAAIDILLDALGIGREALTFRGDLRSGDDEVEWLPAAHRLD